jgi:hypothetical protein
LILELGQDFLQLPNRFDLVGTQVHEPIDFRTLLDGLLDQALVLLVECLDLYLVETYIFVQIVPPSELRL